MTQPNKLTPEQTLEAIFKLLDDIELTPEEVDEELREMGYDPEKVGKRFAQVARDAINKRKALGVKHD